MSSGAGGEQAQASSERGAERCRAGPSEPGEGSVFLESSSQESGGAVGSSTRLSDLHFGEGPPAVSGLEAPLPAPLLYVWLGHSPGTRAEEPTLHTVSSAGGQLGRHLHRA